jgi:hypothetical protein
MTQLCADEDCDASRDLLVLPVVASGFPVPEAANYVCLKSGRPDRWVENPPTLTLLVAADRRDDENDDAAD